MSKKFNIMPVLIITNMAFIVFLNQNNKKDYHHKEVLSEVSATFISKEKAENIALNNISLKKEEVIISKSNLHSENDIKVYEIEFEYGNKDYTHIIDAKTGKIIESKSKLNEHNNINLNNNTISNDGYISDLQAVQIALNHANLKKEDVTITKTNWIIRDDSKNYGIGFTHKSNEYDYEIDHKTGHIINFIKK